MIQLGAQDVTTTTKIFNGVTNNNVTDTLFVSYIEISFESGTVTAMIKRGTVVNGAFVANIPDLRVNVSPDGSFTTPDGSWSGRIPNWVPSLAAIAAPFDNLLLSTGVISGAEIAGSL